MKTIKSILCVVAVLFAVSFSSKAANGFIYDTKYDDNNVMVSKTVFEKSETENTIAPKLKYEFKYDAQGNMTEKVALRWNSSKSNWENYYHQTFTYNHSDNTISVEYGQWNKSKKAFNLKVETKTYTMEEAQKLMANKSTNTENAILAVL